MEKMILNIESEIDKLQAVIVHTPGPEVQNMTPENVERALYSDILNLSIAKKEYAQFHTILKRFSQTFEVKDLLKDVLNIREVKNQLLQDVCRSEDVEYILPDLLSLSDKELARILIEGVELKENNLSRFLSKERFSLRPLHNFFFTRDASVTVRNNVIIGQMANVVREREALIMETIFNHHPQFEVNTFNPAKIYPSKEAFSIEGGDILIARKDILLIGVGERTSSRGVDYILECMKEKQEKRHIIIQELPSKPESFIHLDMTFTFADDHLAVVYEPLILKPNRYQTVHIEIDNGRVKKIAGEENILSVLKKLKMDIKPVVVGGYSDTWIQEREQWHSGANFFALAPGKIMGYERNQYTVEELHKAGLEPIKAKNILNNTINTEDYDKYIITIEGSELARGGGGCRCMTMPILRK